MKKRMNPIKRLWRLYKSAEYISRWLKEYARKNAELNEKIRRGELCN